MTNSARLGASSTLRKRAVRLNADTYPVEPQEVQILAQAGAELIAIEGQQPSDILSAARDCDALMVISSYLPAEVIAALPRCCTIARLGAGTDRIDIAAATRQGIVVSNVPDFCLGEQADHTLALLLSMARRLPTILPPLTTDESLETTRIYSAVGRLPEGESLLSVRPFRSPHHTISDAGMVGGGTIPAPGEISMAHHGVLFLDELPEFNRRSLEVLRQPLEEGRVTISRAVHSTTFPADFVLVASMNPCPCGYLGDAKHPCKCAPMAVEKYLARISGPLLDRIDLHIEVPSVPYEELSKKADGTSSATMRADVDRARAVQAGRFGGVGRVNARMTPRQMRQFCEPDADGREMLGNAMDDLGLSARAHDRILRVSRTIADLEGTPNLTGDHLAEAIGYRTLDRKLWQR